LRSTEGISPIKKNFSEATPLDENAKYLKREKSTLYLSAIAHEGKIPDVEIECGESEISSNTTEIYTHVSKANIARARYPLDTIFMEEKVWVCPEVCIFAIVRIYP